MFVLQINTVYSCTYRLPIKPTDRTFSRNQIIFKVLPYGNEYFYEIL